MIDDVYSLNDFKLPLNDSLENIYLGRLYSIFAYRSQVSLSNMYIYQVNFIGVTREIDNVCQEKSTMSE